MVENPCLACGVIDKDKPMCFRGEPFCCERHRKVVTGELQEEFKDNVPTKNENSVVE